MESVACRYLVLRVEIREQEADRDGRRRSMYAPSRSSSLANQVIEVERHEFGVPSSSSRSDHPDTVGSAHERCRLLPGEVVMALAVDPLDVGDVLEPLRRDVDDGCAAACQHRVDSDGGSHNRKVDIRGFQIGACKGGRDGSDRIDRIRWNLRQGPRPLTEPTATRSVKVPPVSMPTRTPIRVAAPYLVDDIGQL